MREEKLGKLLGELAEETTEAVNPSLAEDIKQQVPQNLTPHRNGMDTINIMIDLRISKLAAAAVIIITMVLWAYLLGGRDSTDGGLYQDSKLLIKYCLGGEDASRSDVLAGMSKFYEYLIHQGRKVVYYGDSVDPEDSNSVLIHWKLPNGKYMVRFVDLRAETVSAEELIKLQARMLQKKTK